MISPLDMLELRRRNEMFMYHNLGMFGASAQHNNLLNSPAAHPNNVRNISTSSVNDGLRKTSAQSSKSTEADKAEEVVIPERFTRCGKKQSVSFPLKLMKVLSIKEYNHMIAWMPDGKAFVIIQPKAFSAEILPKYFKSAQYTSFTRKLHRWGFQRVEKGSGVFYHKDFQRGKVELAEKITSKGDEPPKFKEAMASKKDTSTRSPQDSPVGRASSPPTAGPSSPVSVPKRTCVPKRTSATSSTSTNTSTSTSASTKGTTTAPPAGHSSMPDELELKARRLQECNQAAARSRAALAGMRREMDEHRRLLSLAEQRRAMELRERIEYEERRELLERRERSSLELLQSRTGRPSSLDLLEARAGRPSSLDFLEARAGLPSSLDFLEARAGRPSSLDFMEARAGRPTSLELLDRRERLSLELLEGRSLPRPPAPLLDGGSNSSSNPPAVPGSSWRADELRFLSSQERLRQFERETERRELLMMHLNSQHARRML